MSDLKRDPIKHIRDKAKSRYNKGTKCEICGSQENLDFHHYYSMTGLLEKWLKKTKYASDTDEQILAYRDEFIAAHEYEIFEATVTLCSFHHRDSLHKIYGKSPGLGTSKKQQNWVKVQREKNGLV